MSDPATPPDLKTSRTMVADDGRVHLKTDLMRETLMSHRLGTKLDERDDGEVALLPWAKIINLGGSSIMDRGAKVLLPLVEEILAARENTPIIVSVGGGARMRHTLKIGLELGLPIGGLAQIVGAVEEQNAHLMHGLLSAHGGVQMCREHFTELPKYLLTGMIPIVISVPPYHFWEPPARDGDIPDNGSDLGAYLTAEVLGVSQMIFLKDQDGHYDRDPASHDDAKLLDECHVADLMDNHVNDLALDRAVLKSMNRARHVKTVQVINGTKPGELTRALAGEKTGTLIHQDPRDA
jgi:molybdenum storage protein